MSGDRVRGGWEGEQQARIFDGAKTFDDIFELIRSAAPGSLTDSSGKEINAASIVMIRDLTQKGRLVGGAMINEITRNYGLREAVVRALAPDFLKVSGGNLDYIIQWLQQIQIQQDGLQGIKSGSEKPLTVLSDSGGQPVDIQRYIGDLKYIKDWMMYNQNQPVPNDFYMRFTGNHGIRAAIINAIGK